MQIINEFIDIYDDDDDDGGAHGGGSRQTRLTYWYLCL